MRFDFSGVSGAVQDFLWSVLYDASSVVEAAAEAAAAPFRLARRVLDGDRRDGFDSRRRDS